MAIQAPSNTLDRHASTGMRARRGVPKVCGSDVELGNFVSGGKGITPGEAARILLRQIPGHARLLSEYNWPRSYSWDDARDDSAWSGGGMLPLAAALPRESLPHDSDALTDWGRKFLPGNGGSVYIDLGHLELATPECRSARDHFVWSRAMLRIARGAAEKVNATRPAGERVTLLANNSDGLGASYGSHVSILVSGECFDNIMNFKPLHMQLLASVQAALILFSGAGKVGAENGCSPADFQISARADFIELLHAWQTTHRRPLMNTRDEALCGLPWSGGGTPTTPDLARIHCISLDHVLCPVAGLLRVGVMQIALAMLEQGVAPPSLVLEDPVRALHRWSRDPELRTKAATIDGRAVTATEYLRELHGEAARLAGTGKFAGVVPDSDLILAVWRESVERFERSDWAWLDEPAKTNESTRADRTWRGMWRSAVRHGCACCARYAVWQGGKRVASPIAWWRRWGCFRATRYRKRSRG